METIGPVSLGVKGKPLDYTKWDERCLYVLGRTVKMGERLTQQEWDKLGFKAVVYGKDRSGY